MALFSRVTGKEVLKQQTRGRIYERICERPGSYYTRIREDLDLANGVLLHHLQRLERERLVRRRRSGTRILYYAMDQRPVHRLPSQAAAMMRTVAAHPGVSQAQVAETLAVTRQALHYHVKQAIERGLLSQRRQGRTAHLSLTATADHNLATCPGCEEVHEGRALADVPVTCHGCDVATIPLTDLGRRR